MRWLLLLAMTSTIANADPRADFTAKLARVKPGMTADEVTRILGAPDDVKTEKDPGGITASRTAEVWRYGAVGHLKVATLGTVHIQADKKVQYVFGGKGKPLAGMPEQQLRNLMQLLADVPSYNDRLEPLALVRAVNALHPLGKDKALDVIDEFLRISSPFDDPGREGVFLVMRVLFDVPATGMPPMMVGGSHPAPDPKRFPRHPLVVIGDVPIKIVTGYSLAGHAQEPASDVAAFRKVGALRAKPLAPQPNALDMLDVFLRSAKDVDPAYAIDQALRFFGTVYRPSNRTVDTWHPDPQWWHVHRTSLNQLKPMWNPKTQQMEVQGAALPPLATPHFQRVWWDIGLKGTTRSRLTFERLDDKLVHVELRVELTPPGNVAAQTVRLVDPQTKTELAKLELAAAANIGGTVMTQRLQLTKGVGIRPELASGPRGPVLTP